jgi:hypothetical protein
MEIKLEDFPIKKSNIPKIFFVIYMIIHIQKKYLITNVKYY